MDAHRGTRAQVLMACGQCLFSVFLNPPVVEVTVGEYCGLPVLGVAGPSLCEQIWKPRALAHKQAPAQRCTATAKNFFWFYLRGLGVQAAFAI